MLNGILERIFADGQASAVVAVIGVLAGLFGPKLVKKPHQPGQQPSAPAVHLPGAELIDKLGDHLPILAWFSQLPEEQRAKFFEALKKRVA